jgi:hypothetical protein
VERQGFRRALVIAEVALAVILVVGSGLLIRSFVSLLHVEPGFNPKNLVTMELALAEASYPKDQQVVEFYNSLRAEGRGAAGVKGVTLMSGLPPSRRDQCERHRVHRNPAAQARRRADLERRLLADGRHGYFEMMGIRLIEGRLLTEADRDGAAGSGRRQRDDGEAVLARQSAVGKQLKTAPWNEKVQPQTVVASLPM